MAEIRFHPEAQLEYQDAVVWYQRRSLQASLRFEQEVDQVLIAIASHTRRFPTYDDATRFAMLRRFPWSIVFQVSVDEIQVVAVAHSRHAPGYWQNRI